MLLEGFGRQAREAGGNRQRRLLRRFLVLILHTAHSLPRKPHGPCIDVT